MSFSESEFTPTVAGGAVQHSVLGLGSTVQAHRRRNYCSVCKRWTSKNRSPVQGKRLERLAIAMRFDENLTIARDRTVGQTAKETDALGGEGMTHLRAVTIMFRIHIWIVVYLL